MKVFTSTTHKLIAILSLFTIAAIGSGALGQTDAETREQALKLIKVPDPIFLSRDSDNSKATAPLTSSGSKPKRFKMKDGKYLRANHFVKKQSGTTVILLHGVLSSADKMNTAAELLRDTANADVFAIDLRGHGRSEGTPGDVDRIDQYADDIAQVVAEVKRHYPRNKIILAGHSMGGGISLRFAMLKDHPMIDGLILFAPLLGQNAPTLPQPTAAKTVSSEEPFLKINIERLIGLKMLNSLGEHRHDHLNVLFFNVPAGAPIKAYSYRANESMAPVDYAEGLKAVDVPMLVLVGSNDEAFTAGAFESAVRSNSRGEVFVIENATHNGVTQHPTSMQHIKRWLAAKVRNRKN